MQNEISDFLVELRLEMGNTQNELGQYLGVSNKTVSKWENGVSIPDTFYIPKIAKYYNITCDELLKGCYKLDSDRIKFKPLPFAFCISTILFNIFSNFISFFLYLTENNILVSFYIFLSGIIINCIAIVFSIYKIRKTKSLYRLLLFFYLSITALCLLTIIGEMSLILR